MGQDIDRCIMPQYQCNIFVITEVQHKAEGKDDNYDII